MTDEIICECGHGFGEHIAADGCLARVGTGKDRCYCEETQDDLYRARIQSLQSTIDGQGETIADLRDALEEAGSFSRGFLGGYSIKIGERAAKIYNLIQKVLKETENATLAQTAPATEVGK